MMQKIADAAVRSGLQHPDLSFMAGLGAHGTYPGKCKTQLYKRLPPPVLGPAVAKIKLPFRSGFNKPRVEKTVLCHHAL